MQDRETSGRRRCGRYDPARDHSGGRYRGLVTCAVFRFAAEGSEEEQRSRKEFGSEYERMAQERGSEEEAERELRERRGRVERRVEPLSEESRGRREEQWGEVERVFVDNPQRSIEMADRTIPDILNERDFVSDAGQSDEETERDLAAMPPEIADDYREARRIRADIVTRSAGRAEEDSNEESTEVLRQAIRTSSKVAMSAPLSSPPFSSRTSRKDCLRPRG